MLTGIICLCVSQHATQTHTLRLTQYYDELLASTSHEAAANSLQSSTTLSSTLSHLGELVRAALYEVEGEGPGSDEDEHTEDVQYSRRFQGSGGYTGKAGDKAAQRADAALGREAEIQRLIYENEALKEILGMAEGKGLDVGAGAEKLSLGMPRGAGQKKKLPSLQDQIYPPVQRQQDPSQQTAQQSQQQHQPLHRSTPTDVSAIPSAPFPSALASSMGASPTPPPAPPSQQRMSLHERMQQAAESIRLPPPTSTSTSGAATAPYLVRETPADPANLGLDSSSIRSTVDASALSSSPSSSGSVLVPTPAESATAQSDIRSAPLLPLSLAENRQSEVDATDSEAGGKASEAGDDTDEEPAAEEAISLDDDGDATTTDLGPALHEPQAPVGTGTTSKDEDAELKDRIEDQEDADVPKDSAKMIAEGAAPAATSTDEQTHATSASGTVDEGATTNEPEGTEDAADTEKTTSSGIEAEDTATASE